MKRFTHASVFITVFFLLLGGMQHSDAQILKKLKKRGKKAAEEAVIRKTEQKIYKETSKQMDSLLNPNDKKKQDNPNNPPSKKDPTINTDDKDSGSKPFVIYTNYDFVPGDKIILFEDFSIDHIGDFPLKWNTNGSGEVVQLNESKEKWLQFSNRAMYIPDLPQTLPENFTVEFDMITTGLDRRTSSTARLHLIFEGNNLLRRSGSYIEIGIPFCQYADVGVLVANNFRDGNQIRNYIKKDIRSEITKRAHIAMAIHGKRFRMWVNERKIVDLPRFIEPKHLKYLKFNLYNLREEPYNQYMFLTNLKIAEGGEDLRSKLVKDGKFSTTGILFDSGLANIKPESYGVLKKIAEALKAEADMKILIVGHTDADGSDESNLELSKKRAKSVMDALVDEFGVSPERLQTDGKGESIPVGNNNTTEGKAKNRRVEFIKQ